MACWAPKIMTQAAALLFFFKKNPQNKTISPKPKSKLSLKHLSKSHGEQARSNCAGHGSTRALLRRPFVSARHQTAMSTQSTPRAGVHSSSCFLLLLLPPQCHNISWQISSKPPNPLLHHSAPWVPEIFTSSSLCISKLLPEPSPRTFWVVLVFLSWQFINLPYPCLFACSNYNQRTVIQKWQC